MNENINNGQADSYLYKFCCKYTEKELIDGYKDRKARIRYKRASLGIIASIIFTGNHHKFMWNSIK